MFSEEEINEIKNQRKEYEKKIEDLLKEFNLNLPEGINIDNTVVIVRNDNMNCTIKLGLDIEEKLNG